MNASSAQWFSTPPPSSRFLTAPIKWDSLIVYWILKSIMFCVYNEDCYSIHSRPTIQMYAVITIVKKLL